MCAKFVYQTYHLPWSLIKDKLAELKQNGDNITNSRSIERKEVISNTSLNKLLYLSPD